jgi:hypothetical protein
MQKKFSSSTGSGTCEVGLPFCPIHTQIACPTAIALPAWGILADTVVVVLHEARLAKFGTKITYRPLVKLHVERVGLARLFFLHLELCSLSCTRERL